MRRTRAGFTLIEAMVYSLLLGLLLSGVYSAFYISRAYFDSAQGGTEVQQECLKTLNGLARMLSQGKASTVLCQASGPPGVRILSARTENGVFQHEASTGNLTWQRWAVAYLDTALNEVRLKEVTGSGVGLPSTQEPTSGIPSIASVAGNAALPYKVLGRNITALELTATGATESTAAYVTMRIVSSVQTQRFGSNMIQVVTRVTLKQ